jgi:hypothetical protein
MYAQVKRSKRRKNNNMTNPIIKRSRAPYIRKVGGNVPRIQDPFEENKGPPPYKPQTVKHCSFDGARMAYVSSMRCFYCNVCSNVVELDPYEVQNAIQYENESNSPVFGTADGSRIFNSTDDSSIFGGRRSRSSAGGITVAMKTREDLITDKLRMKDGRSPEMDRIFQQQDRQMEAMGRTILSDKLELKRSSNIKTSDELRAEKSGNVVDLTGTGGRYNPATGRRRTRLSF